MKLPSTFPHRSAPRSGVTLLELTVTVLVLLMMAALLFMGAQAWKRSADRAGCVMQIRSVQTGVRSFANLNGYIANQDVTPRDLKLEVIGSGRFVEREPDCPSGGGYTFLANRIPDIGTLYMTCSLAGTDGHLPQAFTDW